MRLSVLPFRCCLTILALCSVLCVGSDSYAQDIPKVQWQHCYGGSFDDYAYSIIQTRDGGYAFAGYTRSIDGDVSGHHPGDAGEPGEDAWVVKTSSTGAVEWQRCLGGTGQEEANVIIQTRDGGYLVAVRTESFDGDVPDHRGDGDAWIVKLTPQGAIEWSQSFGGVDADAAYALLQTGDSSYAFAGFTRSPTDADLHEHHGIGDDMWVVKLGARDNWQRWLGGSKRDFAYSMVQTPDGGYMVGGFTNSPDGDVTGYKGGVSYDAWLVKLNASGALEWQKTFGGDSSDWVNSVIVAAEGGYVFTGVTNSLDGDLAGATNHGGGDAWVVKTDTAGNVEWQRCLGGTASDIGWQILQATDGGYTIVGYTVSDDGDVRGNHGGHEGWLVKLDQRGNLLWQQCLGGSGLDHLYTIAPTSDGGYILGGYTGSSDNGIAGNHGAVDAWLVKLGRDSRVDGASTALPDKLSLFTCFDPASKLAQIVFDLPSPSRTNVLSVTSSNGEILQRIDLAAAEAGEQHAAVSLSGYPSGTYYLTLLTELGSETRSIRIVR